MRYVVLSMSDMQENVRTNQHWRTITHQFRKSGAACSRSTAFRILPVILELRTLMPCRRLNVYVALFVMLYFVNHFRLLQRL